MRVLFLGRTEWLFETIKYISKHEDIEVIGIISSKESPEYKIKEADFKNYALKSNIKYLYSSKINVDQLVEVFGDKIDIGISVNYVNVIKADVISKFKFGILNAHGGDLPKYRGNAATAWAILNGEEKIGLCIHKMIGGELDSGSIIARDFVKIDETTSVENVYEKFEKIIPVLFYESIIKIKANPDFILEMQSSNPQNILRCYPRLPEDGLINWKDSANKIDRLIRASSEPYSGAFTFFEKQKVIIWKAKLVKEDLNWLGIPGQFAEFDENGYLNILTGHKKLKLIEIEINNERNKPSYFFNSVRRRFNNLKHDF